MLLYLALPGLILWSAAASGQTEEQEQRFKVVAERTKREARHVLKAVMRDSEVEPGPCEIDATWSTRHVRAHTAQEFLGSRLHADLIAPENEEGPRDVIDPDATARGNFCNEEEAKAHWQKAQEKFRANVPADDYSSKVKFHRVQFSMPVFDSEFNTAAVIVFFVTEKLARTYLDHARKRPLMYDDRGFFRRPSIEGFGYTMIYRRKGADWMRIDYNEDWSIN